MTIVNAILCGMEITIDTRDLKTIDESANLLKKYRTTILRWLKEERICGIVIGGKTFIPQSEIDRILKADTELTQSMNKDEV